MAVGSDVPAYRGAAGEAGEVLTWFDRTGKQGATAGPAAHRFGVLKFSPDRKSLATSLGDDSSVRSKADIRSYDLSRGGLPTRLTFDGAGNEDPVLVTRRAGRCVQLPAEGTLGPVSKIGQWSGIGGAVIETPFSESSGQFSPDSRWIAYLSNESGNPEIYTAPFPPGPGGKRQISNGGGVRPVWRQDGKEIIYLTRDRRLMAVEIATGEVHPPFHAASANERRGRHETRCVCLNVAGNMPLPTRLRLRHVTLGVSATKTEPRLVARPSGSGFASGKKNRAS